MVLIAVTNLIKGEPERFIPASGQILGLVAEPLFPVPGAVRINLPLVPTGDSVDLDNNGAEDADVQVFALRVGSNLINDSYLQRIEQTEGLAAYIQDVASGAITEGAFLLYAPDDAQGLPTAIGEDGLWFTADDPVAPLPAGYTVATLGADGAVTLDCSPEATMNTIERAEEKSPNFADQGILESYDSLLDVFKEGYAYTELRNLDWDAIRAEYLPQVEQADADQDVGAFFLALDALAKSLNDTHVSAVSYTLEAVFAQSQQYLDQVGASVGATWQWSASFDKAEKLTSIENPSDYTITFAEDGTVAIQADCNRVNGSYTSDDVSLAITLGPSTLAACPAGSQSDAFLQYLGAVTGYTYDGDNLLLVPQNSNVAGLLLEAVK